MAHDGLRCQLTSLACGLSRVILAAAPIFRPTWYEFTACTSRMPWDYRQRSPSKNAVGNMRVHISGARVLRIVVPWLRYRTGPSKGSLDARNTGSPGKRQARGSVDSFCLSSSGSSARSVKHNLFDRDCSGSKVYRKTLCRHRKRTSSQITRNIRPDSQPVSHDRASSGRTVTLYFKGIVSSPSRMYPIQTSITRYCARHCCHE